MLSKLFSPQIIPLDNMTQSEQILCLLKFVFIMTVIMFLFDFSYSYHFFIISLGFIIIIYYIKKKKMSEKWKENYVSVFESPEPLPFCNDEVSIDPPNSNAVGLNQRLVGRANPKTMIKPVVAPPAYDLDYWKDNNFINFSQINTTGVQQDMYLSGYAESTCCDYLAPGSELVPRKRSNIRHNKSVENYTNEGYAGNCSGSIRSPMPMQDRINVHSLPVNSVENYGYSNKGCSGGIRSPMPMQDRINVHSLPVNSVENYSNNHSDKNYHTENYPIENYTEQYNNKPARINVRPNQSGWVNRSCGYNPQQVYTANLPSNYTAGNCEQSEELAGYNKNLFTQTVTPGVYTRNQVNEPINSNIGISFQQQFEPTTCEIDEYGLQYTQHDPRLVKYEDIIEPVEENDEPRYDNVYDPRFYGYGTSYRSYNDPVTGQTRFMYDDINAIRMPNYITRSKIDHLPFADKYGPMQDGAEFGNANNANIRALAQDSWLRNSLQFRNEITERQMRKINSEAWQRRQAPLGPHRV